MPIEITQELQTVSQEEFDRMDRQIMGLAYDIHNSQGRLFKEDIYKNTLLHKCLEGEFEECESNVVVTVSHDQFVKRYKLDLLINKGVIIELKTVDRLIPKHEGQLINYLLLTELRRGKLINMRSDSVEGCRVQTRITEEVREDYTIHDKNWQSLSSKSRSLKETLINLLEDWGAFLSTSLYFEGIKKLLRPEIMLEKRLDIIVEGQVVGRQKFNVLDSDVGFAITAIRDHPERYQEHLQRMLKHTALQAIEWINMEHDDIYFRTVEVE